VAAADSQHGGAGGWPGGVYGDTLHGLWPEPVEGGRLLLQRRGGDRPARRQHLLRQRRPAAGPGSLDGTCPYL
jgi:hypothetical protein